MDIFILVLLFVLVYIFGGGKHLPFTVPMMVHAGPLAYTEWKAPCHLTVRQGSGAGELAVSRGGIGGEHRKGL